MYEFFEYIPREYECDEVVRYMRQRMNARKNTVNKEDKMINPLIAIPGSPGIGKSTFLSKFPASEQYKSYQNNSIVSTLTFNSGMSSGEDLFELRIIYGACISMGLFDNDYCDWRKFKKEFQNVNLDTDDVVDLVMKYRKV